MFDIKAIKERERKFREKDLPFGIFTSETKTKWWSKIELQNVLNYLGVRDGEDILDIGCSDGRFLEYLRVRFPRCRLFGIDFARNPLKELTSKKFRSYAVCGDICELPFKPNSFDRAAAVQIIQQIPSRKERITALKNINYALRGRGRVVITVLKQKSWCNLVENGKEGPLVTAKDIYVYLYDLADFCEELKEAGFSVIRVVGINNLPVRYLKRLGILGVWLDLVITKVFRPLSLKRSSYLLALCKKK